MKIFQSINNFYSKVLILSLFLYNYTFSQTFVPSDPYYLIHFEKKQFDEKLPIVSNNFRPLFFNSDTTAFSVKIKNQLYYNDNAPNQENMDVRYFSKGVGDFFSVQFSLNNPYFSLIFEPYKLSSNYFEANKVNRAGSFQVLNDRQLIGYQKPTSHGINNLLAFIHYKGLGIGWHAGNRWWGPGIHTSLQMTNNTFPIPAQIIGTIQELKVGSFGFYGLYSFSNLNKEENNLSKYFTSLNGQVTWYGPAIISIGFSRNYLSGGYNLTNYKWTERDARNIVFEGLLTSSLLENEYSIGGHDMWDQTLSAYISATFPERRLKIYSELGFNDNRMYFADFLSQPDHSMATIIGIRDYGLGKNKNIVWGAEWSNIMITYSSRHRLIGGSWYDKPLYDYSTYKNRRWGAHSGGDSDDWYFYLGYLSNKLMIIPAFNYERHGIVTHRPAEVKLEFRLDSRYKYKNIWFGIYFEKQLEAFLGFPDFFYIDKLGNPVDSQDGKLANKRNTNTIILSMSKLINF
jgi:hypothetical protein